MRIITNKNLEAYYKTLQLPSHFEALLEFFTVIDKVFVLTLKCHLDPTVETIARLVPENAFSMHLLLSLCNVTQGKHYI